VTASRRERYRRVILLYGGREPEQLLFRSELDRWQEAEIDVGVTVDIANSEWRGSVGVVPRLLDRVSFEPSQAVAFVCGPEAMIRFTAIDLIDRGVEPGRIHLSLERNMKCAVGQCGHCQLGPEFVCRDGPVLSLERLGRFFEMREI
jgi:NAD(P)H-flavin reductase